MKSMTSVLQLKFVKLSACGKDMIPLSFTIKPDCAQPICEGQLRHWFEGISGSQSCMQY